MKSRKIISLLSTAAVLSGALYIPSGAVLADVGVPITETFFPDPYFRNTLSNYEENIDNTLDSFEIESLTELIVSDPNITDLTGLEFLTNLQVLRISDVNLSKKLDVGVNLSLNCLMINDSIIPDIVLPSNITQIYLTDVFVDHIDITDCPELLAIYNDAHVIDPGWYQDGYDEDLNAIIKIDSDIEILTSHPSSGDEPGPSSGDEPSEPGNGFNGGENQETDPGSGSSSGSSSSSGNSSGNPSGNPSSGNGNPSSSSSSETGVAAFVERLYTVALGRRSDPVGKQSWINAIASGEMSGAATARGFLYSPEFLNKDISNSEFVTILYRTFFDREPDQAGLTAWVNVLDNGAPKEEVIEGFINSTEWANVCVRFGIASGTYAEPSVTVVSSQGTLDFCRRLYTTCLGRDADEPGLNAWARQLTLYRETGESVAAGFFFSGEFFSKNI